MVVAVAAGWYLCDVLSVRAIIENSVWFLNNFIDFLQQKFTTTLPPLRDVKVVYKGSSYKLVPYYLLIYEHITNHKSQIHVLM